MRVSVASSPSVFRLFCACYMHLPIHAPFSYFNNVNRAVREDPYFNLLLFFFLLLLLLLLLLCFTVYICPLFQARHIACPVLVGDQE
jgi:hypothetical protein